MRFVIILPAVFTFFSASSAAPLSVSVTNADAVLPETGEFKMGEARSPDGTVITVDSQSLRLNDRPWTPVMGEFHYSRYPADEWREELLKIKVGGVDIVATYVFWIHHEEIEGEWDWSGRRNLRQFIQAAGDVGLKTIVRCGPWCHGEVRNGGHPDWLLKKGWRVRSNDTNYLGKVRILYNEIARQLDGLLWKDGGPVIGIQLENEYRGPAQHLLTLKEIARDVGLDVPLYTRTGWPQLRTPMPFGEIIPLYGAYAEGFWDRELAPMPGRYWSAFHFSTLRTDANIANELLGRNAEDAPDVALYPYLTCEIGGGMMSSYHRRILVYPADIDSTTLVKLGSGSTSPGYYMYHGGVNPEGKLTTLMESQATGMHNDLPVRNYDFQTALGQYGQVRPQYHSLRRLHLFLSEWGSQFATMGTHLPDKRPEGRDDVETLRWSVRSDGNSGFVFVNNYERLRSLPAKEEVQFRVQLADGTLTFPETPVTIPSGARFLWPFSLDLGKGVELAWASAQPITAIDDGETRTVFFAETPGVPAGFAFPTNVAAQASGLSRVENVLVTRNVKPGRVPAIELEANSGGRIRIVLLSEADSLAIWKNACAGTDRVFLTEASLVTDGPALRLSAGETAELSAGVLPAPKRVSVGGQILTGDADGVFTRFSPQTPKRMTAAPVAELVQPAGPAREIPKGPIANPVAAAPEEEDFKKAAIWRVTLPPNMNLDNDPLLRLHYVGDVARLKLADKLINDDFYNGRPFEIGLRRHAPQILNDELRVEILPLRKDAPIYLASEARPDFGERESIALLEQVELVPRYRVELEAK